MLGLASHGTALAHADDDTQGMIAVVYPDIAEPYRSAFSAITRGIEERLPGRITRIALPPEAPSSNLADELRTRNAKAVIALGRSGLKAASALERKLPLIAGGVLSVPDADTPAWLIQSLAPDPALLMSRLKAFVPRTRRIAVVYDPKQNEWLIRLARESARAQGLDMLTLEAEDLKGALKRYQDLMGQLQPKRDALWLPQDSSTVDESSVLPWLLRESWERGIPVFSSNVNHVRRGALFALYPDNADMGRHLAGAIVALLAASGLQPARGLQPLKQVLTAVNARTAMHLGLDLQSSGQPIHLVLPEQ